MRIIDLCYYFVIYLAERMKTPSAMAFEEKYGIRYYNFLLAEVSALLILNHTKDLQIASGFVLMMTVLGSYLPIKDTENTDHSREVNKSSWLLGPLIVSCITKPIILYYLWVNFEDFNLSNPADFVLGLLNWGFIVSSTIDAVHELLHRP